MPLMHSIYRTPEDRVDLENRLEQLIARISHNARMRGQNTATFYARDQRDELKEFGAFVAKAVNEGVSKDKLELLVSLSAERGAAATRIEFIERESEEHENLYKTDDQIENLIDEIISTTPDTCSLKSQPVADDLYASID